VVVHRFAQFGDGVKPLGHQELLCEWLGEIAFTPKGLADQSCGQFVNGTPLIDIARDQEKGKQPDLITRDQIKLESEEPAHLDLAACGTPGKHSMSVEVSIVADCKRGGVEEADATLVARLRVKVGYQWDKHHGYQQCRSAYSSSTWETRFTQETVDIHGVIRFERVIEGLMKQDDKRYELTGIHLGRTQALSLSQAKQVMVSVRGKLTFEILSRCLRA
jgi:hypothetical protein